MKFTNQKSYKNILNVILFFFKKKYRKELITKLYYKFFDLKPKLKESENLKKIKNEKISSEIFIKNIDSSFFDVSIQESDLIMRDVEFFKNTMNNLELGNNYAVEIIYFLIRFFKPNIVLETGVAAGLSSRCILEALHKNKKGKLYSSDFPYFRLKSPEKYIGIYVPDRLKKNWRLEILGDKENIKKFKSEITFADIIIYDSDKRYSGKKNFFNSVNSLITDRTIIVIDDLHNDSFFFEYCKQNNLKNYFVVESVRGHIMGIAFPNIYNFKNFFFN